MKSKLILALCVALNLNAFDITNVLKQGGEILNNSNSQDYKSLLNVAISKAVDELKGGFINNATAKIDLPPTLKTAANLAKSVGGEKWAKDMQTSINEAATQAVAGAAQIFTDSIKNMSQDDVKTLIQGGDDAMTAYLEKSSSAKLEKVFTPIIEKIMSQNSFANAYNGLNSFISNTASNSQTAKELKSLASNLGADKDIPQDGENLNEYISKKTLEGLFAVMREKESALRANPLNGGKKLLDGLLK
ncbi:DUF4197 domain-containing protein [Campylobacter sp. RM13119]|uniref:DUF4197 domain-containing protein n=1 Tax=Campylobacter californiensis TaxID=1032243 RepID=UPI0014741E42|nr:DUF4197 domain-containing protein [Campylobacter sp. RM13119]MBE3606565.1 DUF4197 domain-containing protein [Campylobacter sp. RM13119]